MFQFYQGAVRGLCTEPKDLVRELQNRSHRTQNDQAVNDRLNDRAFLFLRAQEQ